MPDYGDAGMPAHVILVDEQPGPDGYRVRCIPHGPLYAAFPTPVHAFLAAIQHDNRYGKEWY